MKKLTTIIGCVVSVITVSQAFAQGCSDAGFCTVDALKSADKDSTMPEMNNLLKVGATVGKADYDITILASYIEYNRTFGEHWAADVKLTQLAQLGDSVQSNGLSDIFLTGTYKGSHKLAYTAGVKLPFSDGNHQRNGRSLPLDFQPSLGTIDLIAGVSKEWRKWRFTAALQQPITQNKNGFTPSAFDSISAFSTFQSTNGFERKGDVLLRANYVWAVGKRWKFTPGLLAIYHLGEDTYVDTNGLRASIAGSDGLTLNGTIFAQYSINEEHKLELSGGTPFVVREIRPDGLTRSFVVSLEWKWRF